MIRWKRSWEDLSEAPPLDVMPASNGEFYPKAPSAEQIAVMELQNQEIERVRRKFGMSRRDFVRTSAAMAIGFWAMDMVRFGGKRAFAHNTKTTMACDLEYEGASGIYSLANMPGEFIFDVQSHHVESDGMWRVTNPAFEAFFAGVWSQAGPVTGDQPGIRDGGSTNPGSGDFTVRGSGAGELDPIENLSRYHYLKELFLDSATTMTVLSAVPAAPDITQPLPIDRAAATVDLVNQLSGSQRTVLHAFVMPNRGSAGTVASFLGQEPVYMQREFETMEQRAVMYGNIIRGWKTYPAWGDVPYASGWFFDDELVGQRFIDQVRLISQKYPHVPPNIATHKGFALPGFDQRAASPRDIGPAASRNSDINFIVYHSGYDGESVGAYGGAVASNTMETDARNGDATVNSADRTVSSLIKSLRENAWDATTARATEEGYATIPGVMWANVKNVYAEIGSTWRSVMGDVSKGAPAAAAHLLGKLITYVGPKRIAWGTDSLWFGSPQSEIAGLRRVNYEDTKSVWDFYKLPYAIDGDADDPLTDTRDPNAYAPGSYNSTHIPGWPADFKSHPERSIRNAIFGRNAARVYGVNADQHLLDRSQNSINCDDVQKIRDAYILNQMTPKEQVPLASNTVIGPRTRRELIKMRKEQPWGP